ncbi:metallophosphoesterase [Arthrobacter sp. I2-34]|uniref:Metallophosphoesterase n=1 Tax=Arthrobacter hankyongi TaxID=2904801 RepID=A0ABS9LD61_9MICC|nr:metallophosphoesterase [Arthrobacter hankyongi]MCG2624382.1 metallophosphoesterase [Arthrobacter hankyongi]
MAMRQSTSVRPVLPVFCAAVLAGALVLSGCSPPTELPQAGTSIPSAAPATKPADGTSVHFTAAGDFGANEHTKAVLAETARLQPDLSLALGDFSYGETASERDWCRLVTDAVGPEHPFELISGNHESDGADGDIAEFVRCLPNRLPGLVGTYGRQWYVDVPQQDPVLRLIMISPGLQFPDSSDTDYTAGSPQYRWTAEAIDSARSAGIPWVVVGAHKPCHSLGRYGCGLGQDMTNLLVQKKVDLVLHGHEHFYQRTVQLGLGPGCPSLAAGAALNACIRDKSGPFDAGAGTVFATVGTGGKELRNLNLQDPEAPYFAAYSAENVEPTYGVLDVHVTRTALSAAFVPAAGNGFRDQFTLRRR